MDYFNYHGGTLFAEDVAIGEIAAEVGTPVFVYSRKTIELHLGRIREAFAELSPLVCYSVKANGNLALLEVCVAAGTGFDIVSGGELYRAVKAGADPSQIVYAGVGKTEAEIEQALDAGILFFNVESEGELSAINRVAVRRGERARVALRINPDVDSHAHEYTTTGRAQNKFGITGDEAERIARGWDEWGNLDMVGVDMHIGSQITETEPYALSVARLLAMVEKFKGFGHAIEYFDLGGGFGIFYRGEEAVTAADFAAAIVPLLADTGLKVVMEPGRFVVGNAGVLATRVTYVKKQAGKRFVICDAAMTDLVRPSLYGSYHRIWPAETHVAFTPDAGDDTPLADIVGPVCESGDFLAKERPLPEVEEGALLAIFGAGAYGMVMSSNYNARRRAAEVMVEGDSWRLVRRRETYEDLIAPEIETGR